MLLVPVLVLLCEKIENLQSWRILSARKSRGCPSLCDEVYQTKDSLSEAVVGGRVGQYRLFLLPKTPCFRNEDGNAKLSRIAHSRDQIASVSPVQTLNSTSELRC